MLLNVLAVPRAVLRPERSPALLLAGCKNWSREWKQGKDPGEGEVARVAHESRKVWDKGAELGTNWLILIATHRGAFPFSLEFCFEKNKFVFVYFGSSGYILTLVFHIFPLFGCGKGGWAKKPQGYYKT